MDEIELNIVFNTIGRDALFEARSNTTPVTQIEFVIKFKQFIENMYPRL